MIQNILSKPLRDNFDGKDQVEAAKALLAAAGGNPKIRSNDPGWNGVFCATLILQIQELLIKSEVERESRRQNRQGSRSGGKKKSQPKWTAEAKALVDFVAECQNRVTADRGMWIRTKGVLRTMLASIKQHQLLRVCQPCVNMCQIMP